MSAFPLRVMFDRPGWFVNDVRLVVKLDGHTLYEGSFLQSFDVTEPIAAGPHALETAIEMGFVARTRRYEFTVDPTHAYREPATRYVARLEYSRVWGNFTKRLKLARL